MILKFHLSLIPLYLIGGPLLAEPLSITVSQPAAPVGRIWARRCPLAKSRR